MALSIEIPELYPLSFIVVVLYAFFLVWCGVNVMSARKKYGVKLPAAYEAREDSEFNRYQRVHQNGVESVANFYATLLISALTTPALSAAAGLVYLVGRIVYAQGYYVATENRARGGFYLLGQMYLVGGALYTAFTMLRSA